MSEVFNLRRLWLLLRADLVGDYRPLIIVCAAVVAVLLIFSMLTVLRGGESANYYLVWYYLGLFIWGPLLASYSFKELHDKTRNEAYLTLPASALEKTVARLLRTTIVFFVFLLAFASAASALVEGINWLVFGRRNGLFDASHEAVWAPVGHFIVVASLFFLGAAWFRRMHFVKTGLSVAAVLIGLVCVTALAVSLVFQDMEGINISEREGYNFYLAHRSLLDALLASLQIVYFIVLPLFCWFVAWLRVKETEVSHGV